MKYVKKNYCNRRIHIGLVAHCKEGCKYGLLYGFRKPPYMGGNENVYEHKLLFFEKDTSLELLENTLVSYLSFDYNGFTPNVDYVFPLSSLVVHRDTRGTQRADNVYHDDETWRLINEGKPYVDFESGRNCVIYYPIIQDDTCTIWEGLLGNGIYVSKHTEWLIFEMYNELIQIDYKGWPTITEVAYAICRFKKQIEAINAYEEIDRYQIVKIKQYVSRPGRDDNYFEDIKYCLMSDDKYLSYLLPSKRENIFFDDNATYGDGYSSGMHIMEEETAKAREYAKNEYTKEKHFAFLVSDYFSELIRMKEQAEYLNSCIINSFDVNNASKVANNFQGEITADFRELVDEYNQKTVVGLLEVHPHK